MAVLIMAQQSKSKSNSSGNANNHPPAHNNYCNDDDSTTTTTSQRRQQQQDVKKAMFHDFLGMKAVSADSPSAVLAPKTADASTAASTSVGASSAGGGRGRGPFSTTSDLVSVEKQVENQLEGIPFYTPRSDISGPDISDRLTGSKRSNSDSAFTGSTRDEILQLHRDSPDGLHLMKMLKHGGGGEQSRRSNDDDILRGMQPMGPACMSHVLQQSTGSGLHPNVSKWGRSISMGAVQYHPRGFQLVPSAHQVPANRFRDSNAGPSVISQLVADEGSRTGIKGPGISSIIGGGGISEKIPYRSLPRDSKLNSGTYVPEPETTFFSRRQGLTSASRQMTIFYGGQAHVFDDVHPNKADVIMALAGSNGGSWSTTYSPEPSVKAGKECRVISGGDESSVAAKDSIQLEYHGQRSLPGYPFQGVGSSDRFSAHPGHLGNIIMVKETRNPVQAGEPSIGEKREM